MRRKEDFSWENGYTLIELMVVLVIMGILGSTSVTNAKEIRSRAYDTVLKADLRNVRLAMEGEQLEDSNDFYYLRILTGPGSFDAPYQAATLSDGTTMYAYRRAWHSGARSYELKYQYGWHKHSKWRVLRYEYEIDGKHYLYERKFLNS